MTESRKHPDNLGACTHAPNPCVHESETTLADVREGVRGSTESVMQSGIVEAGQINMLSPKEAKDMLHLLKDRLSYRPNNYSRPSEINRSHVLRSLETNHAALWSLYTMELTGGSPDVLFEDEEHWTFVDCSCDSPSGRRNCVFDKAAEQLAKGTFNGNAVDMAKAMGIRLPSADFYLQMMKKGHFDFATWNWIETSDIERRRNLASYGENKCNIPCTILVHSAYDHDIRGGWRGYLKVPKSTS